MNLCSIFVPLGLGRAFIEHLSYISVCDINDNSNNKMIITMIMWIIDNNDNYKSKDNDNVTAEVSLLTFYNSACVSSSPV